MAESDGSSAVNASPEKQTSDTKELYAPTFQWVSGTRPVEVAIVRPLPRNVNFDGRPRAASSSASSSSIIRTPPSSHGHISPVRIGTQPQPFSFFERDTQRRAAFNQRMEELRQEEERQWMASRFRANPIRRYKPLVLKPSTRPLTIPQDPLSRE